MQATLVTAGYVCAQAVLSIAQMDAFIPNYESFYRNHTFSDVDVVIVEEDEGHLGSELPEDFLQGVIDLKQTLEDSSHSEWDISTRGVKIPAHSMVLIPFSGYCRVKVSRSQINHVSFDKDSFIHRLCGP